jgi:hypothetical protein
MTNGYSLETAMDENLFNVAAKLQADRVRAVGTVLTSVGELDVGAATSRWTRHLLAFGAALLVNAAVIGGLEWSTYAARPVPEGQVVITQLDSELEVRVARN